MTYKYLYQNKKNENCEGEIKAHDRNEAYALLRKQGVRPYRLIGDDPWNWKPWAIAVGYLVLIVALLAVMGRSGESEKGKVKSEKVEEGQRSEVEVRGEGEEVGGMTEEEKARFREKAEDAVYRAPEAFRYNVWKGVNARLVERGLEPLERPEGLIED